MSRFLLIYALFLHLSIFARSFVVVVVLIEATVLFALGFPWSGFADPPCVVLNMFLFPWISCKLAVNSRALIRFRFEVVLCFVFVRTLHRWY